MLVRGEGNFVSFQDIPSYNKEKIVDWVVFFQVLLAWFVLSVTAAFVWAAVVGHNKSKGLIFRYYIDPATGDKVLAAQVNRYADVYAKAFELPELVTGDYLLLERNGDKSTLSEVIFEAKYELKTAAH